MAQMEDPMYETLKASQSHEDLNTSTVSLDVIEPAKEGTPENTENIEMTTITAQPSTVIHVETHHHDSPGDHYLLLSVMSSICCFCCGTWVVLFCTIPAIIFSVYAQNAEARGNVKKMKENERSSLILNIIAIISYVVIVTVYIILIITLPVTQALRNESM